MLYFHNVRQFSIFNEIGIRSGLVQNDLCSCSNKPINTSVNVDTVNGFPRSLALRSFLSLSLSLCLCLSLPLSLPLSVSLSLSLSLSLCRPQFKNIKISSLWSQFYHWLVSTSLLWLLLPNLSSLSYSIYLPAQN